jgi:DNA-binding GntR family transcriptional regulator
VTADGKPSRKVSSPAASDVRKRGRRPNKLEMVKEAMRCDIREGRQTAAGFGAMLEKTLASTYGVSRDTARKARIAVLSEIVEN